MIGNKFIGMSYIYTMKKSPFSVSIKPVNGLHVQLEIMNPNTNTERVECMYNSNYVITYFMVLRNSVGFRVIRVFGLEHLRIRVFGLEHLRIRVFGLEHLRIRVLGLEHLRIHFCKMAKNVVTNFIEKKIVCNIRKLGCFHISLLGFQGNRYTRRNRLGLA